MSSSAVQRRPKDTFQQELDDVIQKRRSKGYSTGFSDAEEVGEDYDDDFDEESDDDDILKQFTKPSKSLNKTMKGKMTKQDWKLPSYLQDDDDESSDDDPSQFLKTTKPTSPTDKLSKKSSKPTPLPQSSVLSKTMRQDDGDNPLLSLLNDNLHGGTATSKSDKPRSKSPFSPDATQTYTSPRGVGSPRVKSPTYAEEKIVSPRSRTKSPLPSTSFQSSKETIPPGMEEKNPISPLISPRLEKDSRNRKKFESENKSENLNPTVPVRRPRKTNGKNQEEKSVDEILSSMRRSLNEDRDSIDRTKSSSEKPVKEGASGSFKSQSIIDFLLDDPNKPKPAPRKKGAEEVEVRRSRSRSGSRPGTPGDLKSHHRSPTPPSARDKKRKESENERVRSPTSSSQDRPSSFPPVTDSIMTSSYDTRARDKRRAKKVKDDVDTQVQRNEQRSPDKTSTTDELLALFEQVNTTDDPNRERKIENPQTTLDERVNPVEEVVDKTINEMSMEKPKQTSSNHLMENVIENIATHNEDTIHEQGYDKPQKENVETTEKKKVPATRLGSSSRMNKSYRTPPVGYQGLGSVTALKQLQTYHGPKEDQALNSTADIRETIYMQWLADREVKIKERKKQEKLKKKEEEEKKVKAEEEKRLDGESARRAWMEDKEKYLKEQEKRKRREERKQREEKMKKEEEKWKSEKKGDMIRKKKIEEARRKHREEEKRKREEEMLQKEKERQKKEENEKALNEWNKKRSTEWVQAKKKEKKEKSKIEKEKQKEKEKKSEEAQDKYAKWRERKEEQLKNDRHRMVEDEDRPTWRPANKVIPFGR
uniref:microtubule-associated protein 9 isoform X2 n=1 Tax=Ciona intestinalis TaxID=7719 RepID=UPI000EF44ABB|nr:microtubule-associated protein 9 isoform X2 [Ciona intestinalis]|eukprot:XP_026695881.1 microtubule-associated protein 9 isoform X2 [Ciona intestinalis]